MCKEHLLYNEKKQSIKDIVIVFDPRQLFDLSNNFMDRTTHAKTLTQVTHVRQTPFKCNTESVNSNIHAFL